MARPDGHMFYIGLHRENVKKSSCLKQQGNNKVYSLDIWCVASPREPLPSLFKL